MAKDKCDRCGKPATELKRVSEVVDRFEVAEGDVCPTCVKQVAENNRSYQN